MKSLCLVNKKINIAIIGSNFIVDTFLAAAAKVAQFNFYAIYSRKEATGKAKAEKYRDMNSNAQ